MIRGSRRVATSRPAYVHAQRTGQDDASTSLPPDHGRNRKRVSEVRTKLAHIVCANSVVSPSMLAPFSLPGLTDAGGRGLSFGLSPSAPAVLDRSAARRRTASRVFTFAMPSGLVLSGSQPGF